MSDVETFDYVIVGAGTAGCVIAARLADTGASVLLLEQGSDGSDDNVRHADLDHLFRLWDDQNQIFNYPMAPRSAATDRWPELMRGRTVGGSGAVNVMIHTRANRADFAEWEKAGGSGWSFENVLQYYKLSETDPAGETEYHGGDGPIQILQPEPSVYADAMIRAAMEMGFDGPDHDLNGKQQEGGAGMFRFAAGGDGIRSSSAEAYLTPKRRASRLDVRHDAEVLRILLGSDANGPRATGIAYRQPKTWFEVRVHASKQVILCCGALESPKLLMLSGIGPAEHLAKLGIVPRVPLQGVGRNLQDHVISGIPFAGSAPIPRLQFLTEAGLFANVLDGTEGPLFSTKGYPTVQYFLNAGIRERKFPWAPDDFFGMYPSLTRPDTVGEVALSSTDPRRPPIIRMDYLSAGRDMDTLINALKLAMQMVRTKPLADLYVGDIPVLIDGSRVAKLTPETPRDQLAEFLGKTARGLWHPVGTCAMGPDPAEGAVVDANLSVHGVDGLSVCDASVFPRMTSGNPNATVIAIAEKFSAEAPLRSS